jgi:hypothetical protein
MIPTTMDLFVCNVYIPARLAMLPLVYHARHQQIEKVQIALVLVASMILVQIAKVVFIPALLAQL